MWKALFVGRFPKVLLLLYIQLKGWFQTECKVLALPIGRMDREGGSHSLVRMRTQASLVTCFLHTQLGTSDAMEHLRLGWTR